MFFVKYLLLICIPGNEFKFVGYLVRRMNDIPSGFEIMGATIDLIACAQIETSTADN